MNSSELLNKGQYQYVSVKGRGRMLAHRYIMEQALGRELLPHEQVHHRDKNKSNNDILNLEICPTAKSHAEEHAYGEEELIEFLIQYNHEYGKFPTWRECSNHIAMPHPSTFRRVFGGWKRAKLQAQHKLDIINEEW